MNIHDIAKLSGYSAATVSRVINNRKYVSDDAKLAVQKIIKEYDYVPNDVARDLSKGKTHNIGVVMPYTKHPYYTGIINGVMDAAFPAGYRIVLLPSMYDADVEMNYLNRLRRKAYDAIIFTSHGVTLDDLLEYQKYGSIVCCHDPGNYDISAAYTERIDSYLKAFTWAKAQNVKKVAILLSRNFELSATSQLTRKAFIKIFHHEPLESLLRTDVITYSDGYRSAQSFYKNNVTPDLIFANGDDVATGARQFYLDHHLPIPTLIGQENQLSGQLLNLPTIDHNFHEIGRLAFELAIGDETKQVSVASRFILRNQNDHN
ncbi:LacI family DNA-binding transcriptional regulator [Companilactobacillus baiquanensis]|uniref:LacI family DNA-binding transcriptional regulator n=1 Tax=Companilactobacillus baiquanensis TaxID=2486005 RepID=A0ABW1V0A3_9LACO|nr:LacI family DNA-binding transcriptional regulator [Companilactobacillus baiquanensis]